MREGLTGIYWNEFYILCVHLWTHLVRNVLMHSIKIFMSFFFFQYKVGDMEVYRTGAGNKCIIWCYDIYGFTVSLSTYNYSRKSNSKESHVNKWWIFANNYLLLSIFCWCQGGRTRQLCDMLADAGYLVILPDFFRGEWRVSEK